MSCRTRREQLWIRLSPELAGFLINCWVFGLIWKAWLSSLIWCMAAWCPTRSDWVTDQNVESFCPGQAQLRKQKKILKVWCGVKCIKSMTFITILCQLLSLGHLEIARSNFKKSVNPGLSNLGWKKGSLAMDNRALHCEMARKQECPSLFSCHFANSWSWVGYCTSFERGMSGLSADEKKLEYFLTGRYF